MLYHRQNWFSDLILRGNRQRPDKLLFCNCLYWDISLLPTCSHTLYCLWSPGISPSFLLSKPWKFHPGPQVTPWAHFFLPFRGPASTPGQWHTLSQNKPWLPPLFHTVEHVKQLSWLSAPVTDLQNGNTFNWSPPTAAWLYYSFIYHLTGKFFHRWVSPLF